MRAQVINLLQNLHDEFDLSYMFIAHDLSVVNHISDRIAVMYLGRIVELSECDELYSKPLHPYTQALLFAIPEPKPCRKKDRIILRGEVPNPINQPKGGHFHPRCPPATEQCNTVTPPVLREARPGHSVACHLVYFSWV